MVVQLKTLFNDKSLVVMYYRGIVSVKIQLHTLPSWSLSWKLGITADENRHVLESAASELFTAAWLNLVLVYHAVCVLESSVLSLCGRACTESGSHEGADL